MAIYHCQYTIEEEEDSDTTGPAGGQVTLYLPEESGGRGCVQLENKTKMHCWRWYFMGLS